MRRYQRTNLPDKRAIIRKIDVVNSLAETYLGKTGRKRLKRSCSTNRHRNTRQRRFKRCGIPEVGHIAARDNQFTVCMPAKILNEKASKMTGPTDNQDFLTGFHASCCCDFTYDGLPARAIPKTGA